MQRFGSSVNLHLHDYAVVSDGAFHLDNGVLRFKSSPPPAFEQVAELVDALRRRNHLGRDGVDGLLTIGGGKMSDFQVMAEAVTTLACAKLGGSQECRTFRETLDGRPVTDIPDFSKPWRPVKRFLRHHPRLRELHALAYLGAGLGRHLVRRALGNGRPAAAESLKDYYAR